MIKFRITLLIIGVAIFVLTNKYRDQLNCWASPEARHLVDVGKKWGYKTKLEFIDRGYGNNWEATYFKD